MKFERITGPVTICTCRACHRQGPGGDEPYQSASTGKTRTPEDWYASGPDVYCAECAAKLVQPDPARSITRYYDDTRGTSTRVGGVAWRVLGMQS